MQIIANNKNLLRLLCASTGLNTFLTNFTFNVQFNICKPPHQVDTIILFTDDKKQDRESLNTLPEITYLVFQRQDL